MGYKEYWLPFEVILNPPDQIDYGLESKEINIIEQDFSVIHAGWESDCFRLSSVVGEENRKPNPPSYLFWPNKYTSKMFKLNFRANLVKYFLISDYKLSKMIHYHVLKTNVPVEKYRIQFQLVPTLEYMVIEDVELKTKRFYKDFVLADLYLQSINIRQLYHFEDYKAKYLMKRNPKSKLYKVKALRLVKHSKGIMLQGQYEYKVIKDYTNDFTNIFLNIKCEPYTIVNSEEFKTIFATITLSKNTSSITMRGSIYVIKDNNDNA